MITRRKLLLAGSSMLPLAAAACNATLPWNQISSTVASDMSIIATGLQGALSGVQSLNIPGLTQDVKDKVTLALQTIQAAAAGLQAAATATQAAPIFQQAVAAFQAILNVVAGLPLPPQIALPLQAAAILFPVIAGALQLVIQQFQNVPAAPATSARITSADQARSVLIGASKH